MVTYDRFDVVLVLFPFSEKIGQKQRPAIVLTDKAFNHAHGHAITAMVTTASNTHWPSDIRIIDPQSAGLREPSTVRLKLFTIASSVIIGRVGTLMNADGRSVVEGLLAQLLP